MHKELIGKINDAILNCDEGRTIELIKSALEERISPLEIVERGLREGVDEVGKRFERGECFLPELVRAGRILENSLKIIGPALKEAHINLETSGKVILGTPKGDIHFIGKKILEAMIRAKGFDIIDLGEDVSAEDFFNAAKNNKPDVLGISILLTISLPEGKKIIDKLVEGDIRDSVKVIFGGAATTKDYAEKIGADSWASNAWDGAREIERIVQNRRNKGEIKHG